MPSPNTRWLLLLCLAQLFIMLVFINYSAVLPLLKQEWGMSNTQAGTIFSVYQLGYIASGVVLSALTDRGNTRTIFIASALWSAAANLLFALFAHDYASGLLLRGLTGVGMGGTYMPGLKLVAERFPSVERGKAVGIYVGALLLGARSPWHLPVGSLPWQGGESPLLPAPSGCSSARSLLWPPSKGISPSDRHLWDRASGGRLAPIGRRP